MSHQLAGLFVKRVCMFWQLPGERRGTVQATKICDTEPTLLLVVLVAGGLISVLVMAILYATRNRNRVRARPAARRPVADRSPNGSSIETPLVQHRPPDRGPRQGEVDVARESKRHAYVRLMAFVDNAMADV